VWFVGRSVCLSVTTVSPAKVAELMVMLFGMFTWVGPRNHVLDGGQDPRTWRDNFDSEKGPTQDMLRHVRQSIYSKRLSRGQNLYDTDADWSVLDGVHIGPPGKYDWTLRVRRRCCLTSNYFDYLFCKYFVTVVIIVINCTYLYTMIGYMHKYPFAEVFIGNSSAMLARGHWNTTGNSICWI